MKMTYFAAAKGAGGGGGGEAVPFNAAGGAGGDGSPLLIAGGAGEDVPFTAGCGTSAGEGPSPLLISGGGGAVPFVGACVVERWLVFCGYGCIVFGGRNGVMVPVQLMVVMRLLWDRVQESGER